MGLNESVSVSMQSAAKTVSLQNLGLQLIVGPNIVCNGRTVSVPVANGGDPAANAIQYINGGNITVEYARAKAAFTQGTSPNGAPATIKLGAMGGAAAATATIIDNAGTFTGGTISANINGIIVSTAWITDKNTTLATLAAAMQVALRAQTSGDTTSTVTYTSGTHTILVTPKSTVSVFVAFVLAGITGTMTISSITYSAPETYADALTRLSASDDSWYQLTIASTLTADILAVSAWVNANTSPKFFFYKTADANVVNVDPATDAALTTSGTVAAQVLATKARRTAAFYNGLGQYFDSSIAGYIAGFQPGTYNVAYTQPDGSLTPDSLNQTQHNNAAGYYSLVNGLQAFTRGKDVNTLETVAGYNIVRWGTCQDGVSWIDAVIFNDYLVGALQAAVYAVLINNPKVPYDINGKAMILAAMESVFKPLVSLPGVTRPITAYAEDSSKNQAGGYKITFPSFTDPNSPDGYVSSTDRLNRVLNNLKWQCWYSGAINSIHMIGLIS